MPEVYLILVILLFVLAITDLVVGVSNDAVNFLNSAIGSKVAPMRTIMIVASVGIFIGAAFSSGMMEVARKSIFHPEAFTFAEIMALFTAVMITDIILLDLFNSIGMPTSTTVSIVFELLGAAVIISLVKMNAADQGLSHITEYINGSTALTIILGILLSVVIAFGVGALVQYVSRLIFSFKYEKRLKYVGSIWAGLSLTAMTYFLLIKGLKHASFVEKETLTWIKEHTLIILGASFASWTLVLQLITSFTKFNILKIVVLFGTFALAMAFAGNDLVNFIGVPIAGFESYKTWLASGSSPDSLMMDSLGEAVQTAPYLLFIAGGVMVLTLWGSKKARSVVETSIKLSRQDEGAERFRPNVFSRSLVRFSYWVSAGIVKSLPKSALEKIEKNFQPVPLVTPKGDKVAFDLIRASVNLAVASMLISLATSMKLPLSTTYVTFMVAMGASLADRAWGRDSAVFRVAGVVQVIAGWFGTALIAFTVCAVFAFLILNFGMIAIGGLVALAIFLVVRSNIIHKRRSEKEARMDAIHADKKVLSGSEISQMVVKQVAQSLDISSQALNDSFDGLIREDLSQLKKSRKEAADLVARNEQMRYSLFHLIKRAPKGEARYTQAYLKTFDYDQDLVQSVELLVNTCCEHVENVHSPLENEQEDQLRKISYEVVNYLDQVKALLKEDGDAIGQEQLYGIKEEESRLKGLITEALNLQSTGIKEEKFGSRNSLLVFTLLLETKDLVEVAAKFVELFSVEPEESSATSSEVMEEISSL